MPQGWKARKETNLIVLKMKKIRLMLRNKVFSKHNLSLNHPKSMRRCCRSWKLISEDISV